MVGKSHDYDNFDWSRHFALDPSSPSGLVWNRNTYSLGGNKLETWVGKPAGQLRDVKNGDNLAWSVSFQQDGVVKHYKVHRIIAVLSGMSVNGKVIDHINGDSSDNRIENLRSTSVEVNARNRRVASNSPYGITGVGSYEDRAGNLYFTSCASINGKRVQESFPVKRLGLMPAFLQATASRMRFIDCLNSSYPTDEQYTKRHTRIEDTFKNTPVYTLSKEDYSRSFITNKIKSNNTSGFVGISFSSDKKGNTVVTASFSFAGKSRNKKFSVKKYGLLPAFKMACEYRIKMIEELNQQGAGYTENHGK